MNPTNAYSLADIIAILAGDISAPQTTTQTTTQKESQKMAQQQLFCIVCLENLTTVSMSGTNAFKSSVGVTVFHKTLESAERESERLATVNPGKTFAVLKAISSVTIPKPELTRTTW